MKMKQERIAEIELYINSFIVHTEYLILTV